tara:strand:- start:338 stop:637 length:300 start_codon:yes stop_codon:yes gene_type:complete
MNKQSGTHKINTEVVRYFDEWNIWNKDELIDNHALLKILKYIDLVCQEHEGYKMITKSSESVIRHAIQKTLDGYKIYDPKFRIKNRQIPSRIGIYSTHS